TPSGRVWNSAGPPSSSLLAIVPPPPPLELLLDFELSLPQAVSSSATAVTAAHAAMVLCFMALPRCSAFDSIRSRSVLKLGTITRAIPPLGRWRPRPARSNAWPGANSARRDPRRRQGDAPAPA